MKRSTRNTKSTTSITYKGSPGKDLWEQTNKFKKYAEPVQRRISGTSIKSMLAKKTDHYVGRQLCMQQRMGQMDAASGLNHLLALCKKYVYYKGNNILKAQLLKSKIF